MVIKECKTKIVLGVISLLILTNSHSLFALEILETGYHIQTYVSLPSPGLGRWQGMEFDSLGNLYLSFQGSSSSVKDGGIYRIKPDKTGSVFATGFYSPEQIVWSGGTNYGENLYVADADGTTGSIGKVNLSGTITTFCNPSKQPTSVGLDRTGNYSNSLYAGTSAFDHIDKISTAGSITRFSDYPYDIGGGSPKAINFDPANRYDGLMYVGTWGDNASWSGVFSLDTSGNPTRFSPTITKALDLEFDEESRWFGGDLFAWGITSTRSVFSIYHIDPDGLTTEFAREGLNTHINIFDFGPDGAMYILKDSGGTLTISRVVPEPATFSILALGTVLLFKRKKIRS